MADDFTFRIRGAMGSVLVRANGPPGGTSSRSIVDGEDITDTPVSLLPGTSIRGARVLLTQAGDHRVGVGP